MGMQLTIEVENQRAAQSVLQALEAYKDKQFIIQAFAQAERESDEN